MRLATIAQAVRARCIASIYRIEQMDGVMSIADNADRFVSAAATTSRMNSSALRDERRLTMPELGPDARNRTSLSHLAVAAAHDVCITYPARCSPNLLANDD